MTTTFESLSQYVECAICHRLTSKNHAEKFFDFWVCCWCDQ